MSVAGNSRVLRAMAAAAALGLVLLVGAAPAYAQSTSSSSSSTTANGYNVTTTTLSCPGPISADLGTLAVGETGTGKVGGFPSGGTEQWALNGGSPLGTVTADANGCATMTVTPTASGSALGRAIFAVQGLRLASAGSIVTINGVTGITAKPPGQQNTITISGPGANGGTRVDTVLFKVAASSAQGTALTRTGAMILRWAIVGVVLIALGFAVLALNRRRHSAAG